MPLGYYLSSLIVAHQRSIQFLNCKELCVVMLLITQFHSTSPSSGKGESQLLNLKHINIHRGFWSYNLSFWVAHSQHHQALAEEKKKKNREIKHQYVIFQGNSPLCSFPVELYMPRHKGVFFIIEVANTNISKDCRFIPGGNVYGLGKVFSICNLLKVLPQKAITYTITNCSIYY